MTQTMTHGKTHKRLWRKLMPLAELPAGATTMKRIAGKQIAVFDTSDGLRACDNRCPHEGYPLSEGSLSRNCVLTCNWHNWKFDLSSGDNLLGGDRLRTYPLQVRGDDIWIDITEPPFAERYTAIVQNLHDAFDDYNYDRIAREISRLMLLGADPCDVLRSAIEWSWQKMEFGWTHAYAGMADWLTLYDEYTDDNELQLVCLVESVAHIAYDVLRESDYAFTQSVSVYDEATFVAAIEAEQQDEAIAAIRGGIRAGLKFADFEAGLTRAALSHYNDFGHSLIYVSKVGGLIERLGESVMEPLLLSLVRSIVFASREDRIPEFRCYAEQLENWGQHRQCRVTAQLWRHSGINQSLQTTIDCSGNPSIQIYQALLLANAINLLSFDTTVEDKIRVSVSSNVGWLDFTHGLTFANAVRQQCSKFPDLWPQGLLQMACFSGRNATFTSAEIGLEQWQSDNPKAQLDALVERVMDHGQGEHIVSVHLLKTALAVRDELRFIEQESLDWRDAIVLVAALTRFFDSPLKRRRARRTAFQSLQFVAKE